MEVDRYVEVDLLQIINFHFQGKSANSDSLIVPTPQTTVSA